MESQSTQALKSIINVQPFSDLSEEGKKLLSENIEYKYYSIGERIYRNDELPFNVNFIIKGEARILVQSTEENSLITIERRGPGTFIGWVSLIRGRSCETVQVSKDLEAISLSSEVFVRLCLTEKKFANYFNKRVTPAKHGMF